MPQPPDTLDKTVAHDALHTARRVQNDHVLSLVHMLSNRIGRAFQPLLAAHGVSVAEWRVMLSLAGEGRASGRDITSRWAMDKMAINRAIKSLETRGLVEKSPNPDDRRALDLSLTDDGRRVYDTLVPLANARYTDLMACLSRDEERALKSILAKMIGHADTLIG